MMEGPITWGSTWQEIEDWLARIEADLGHRNYREDSHAYRRLAAHVIRRQIPHLPSRVPPWIAAFLIEFP